MSVAGRRVLIDTGPLVALRNTKDQHRARLIEIAPSLPPVLYTTWPVLTEACFLLRAHPEEPRKLIRSLGNALKVVALTDQDAPAVAAILEKYADQPFSLADASLMHIASRDDFDAVVTIDRKDFAVWAAGERPSLEIID